MTPLAILLAVLGAVCFAFAARLQHTAVRSVEGTLQVTALLRRPRWLAGLALLVIGAGVHAVALGMAPLSVVQPVGVLAIGITAVLDGRREALRAVALTTVGVGAFVLLAAGSATATEVAPQAELQAGLLVLGLVALPGLFGVLTQSPHRRALAFGVAGGVAYGYVSVLMRAVSQDVQQGGFGWTSGLSVLGIVLALLVGGWFIQHAYASGPPHLAVACLTVVDPLVAVCIGAGLLGEAARMGGWIAVTQLGCAAIAISGVWALARRETSTTATTRSEKLVNNGHALRVVIAAETFPPDVNGAARFAQRLAVGLAGRDHDVHVICPSPEGPASTQVFEGVTVHRLRSQRTPFYGGFRSCLPWHAKGDVARLLADLKPDLVHVQAHFVIGRHVLRQATALGIPTVATNHFMPENLFGHAHVPQWFQKTASRLAWRDLAKVYGVADAVTAPTPRAVQLLHDSGFPERAVPISCGIDIDRYRLRKSTRITAGGASSRTAVEPTVLFVGRLDEEKRVDELLRALAMVPRLRADIVGDGTCRAEWELLAADLGITDRVQFHGCVDEEALLDAYANADVFCMPGIAELQSLATMEAMAAGKPVVAADAMALPHLVRPGRNGWLFQPGDVQGLADRLHGVLADPAMTARMGAASSELIAGHAIGSTLDKFEELYFGVLGRPVLVPVPVPVPELAA
jgi:glycosyltransferase involved in cell wall biosynthesis